MGDKYFGGRVILMMIDILLEIGVKLNVEDFAKTVMFGEFLSKMPTLKLLRKQKKNNTRGT
jgi:hypothetical protein